MVAGILSAAVLAWRGQAERSHPAAPLNAPAHWFFGRRSLRQDRPSWKHTATGIAVHQASSVFWAVFYGLLRSGHRAPGRASALVDAAAISALAALVDLEFVPERLTPGFERKLSSPSLAGVYVAFAAGLALLDLVKRR